MGTLAMKQEPIIEPQKYTSPRSSKEGTPTLTLKLRPLLMKVSP